MSEALKANTTLTALTLWGVNKLDKAKQCNNMSISEQTGNEIGAEGARALSGALKVNTTLTTLDLESVEKQQDNTRHGRSANNNEQSRQLHQ